MMTLCFPDEMRGAVCLQLRNQKLNDSLAKGGKGSSTKMDLKKAAARRGKGPKGAGASDSEDAQGASGAARGGHPGGSAASIRPARRS